MNFVPRHDGTFEAIEKGRIVLLLNADDGTAPTHFAKEVIFEVDFVCSGEGEQSLARFDSEAVSRSGPHWYRDSGRNPDAPGEEIGRDRRRAPLPRMGALSHDRDAQSRLHESSRHRAQAHGGSCYSYTHFKPTRLTKSSKRRSARRISKGGSTLSIII